MNDRLDRINAEIARLEKEREEILRPSAAKIASDLEDAFDGVPQASILEVYSSPDLNTVVLHLHDGRRAIATITIDEE